MSLLGFGFSVIATMTILGVIYSGIFEKFRRN
jgi:hypothetical protein